MILTVVMHIPRPETALGLRYSSSLLWFPGTHHTVLLLSFWPRQHDEKIAAHFVCNVYMLMCAFAVLAALGKLFCWPFSPARLFKSHQRPQMTQYCATLVAVAQKYRTPRVSHLQFA